MFFLTVMSFFKKREVCPLKTRVPDPLMLALKQTHTQTRACAHAHKHTQEQNEWKIKYYPTTTVASRGPLRLCAAAV